jgi:heterodisulfide reductase subunit A
LKEISPNTEAYVLYRDMRTYGTKEDFYRKAAEADVRFVRFEPPGNPSVESSGQALKVTAHDPVLGKTLEIDADYVVLAAAIVPSPGAREVAALFNLPLSQDGFFKEAHAKLRPVEFASDGVYLCGMAHYPKDIPETVSQAQAAAARALTLLSRDTVKASGSVCEVEEKRCIGCGACVEACTYGAVELHKAGAANKARVNPVLCKGCGLCNAKCPTAAISLKHFTDEELSGQIEAAFEDTVIARRTAGGRTTKQSR